MQSIGWLVVLIALEMIAKPDTYHFRPTLVNVNCGAMSLFLR